MMRKAIINIFSSYNNVLLTATDLTGAETIATCSCLLYTSDAADE